MKHVHSVCKYVGNYPINDAAILPPDCLDRQRNGEVINHLFENIE